MTITAPPRALILAWAALLALLALTVTLAYQPLHAFNGPMALLIATIKALIVAVVFMELREARGLLIAVAAAGFFWLAILLWFVWTDITTRPEFPPRGGSMAISPKASGSWEVETEPR